MNPGIVKEQVPRLRRGDSCFACGKQNPDGLHLHFTPGDDGAVMAIWRAEERWEGFPGVVHGGIVSTLLDEAMSKAVASSGVFALTCELRVRLHQHVQRDEELCVRGWVVEKRKRKITTSASVTGTGGREKARAWATFLEVPQDGR